MPPQTKEAGLSVENQVELRALCEMLRLAGGFTLEFARVNHPSLRQRLVLAVKQEFPEKSIYEVTLDPSSPHGIVPQLDEALGDDKPDAMFVYGLEKMLDLTVEQSPKMDLLNQPEPQLLRQALPLAGGLLVARVCHARNQPPGTRFLVVALRDVFVHGRAGRCNADARIA